MTLANIELPTAQYKFCPTRKWRADFAWPKKKIILEVEGGVFTNGRHVRGKGFIADCEKYNWATLQGWAVYRVTSDCVNKGKALNLIDDFLKEKKK